MSGWATQPQRGFCEGLVIKALGTRLVWYRTEALAVLLAAAAWWGMSDFVQHAGGVGTYLLVDAKALLRRRGKAASHSEMWLLHHDRW